MDYQKEAFVLPAATKILRNALGNQARRAGTQLRGIGLQGQRAGQRAKRVAGKVTAPVGKAVDVAKKHPKTVLTAGTIGGAAVAGPVSRKLDAVDADRIQNQTPYKPKVDRDKSEGRKGDPRDISTHLYTAGGLTAAALGTLILLDQLNKDEHDKKVK